VPDVFGWIKPALSGLTTRGRSFLAAGVAAAFCSALLGQPDLMRIGILLIVLPLGSALVLARTRFRLALTRTVTPARVVAGSQSGVRLELENLTRLGTRVLLAEERVPYALGAPPRFVLDRLPGGRAAAVTYAVRSELRGRYEIGPLRLRLADAFGMCELTRSFTSSDPLIVVPRTWPLTSARAGGMWAGSGESVVRTAAASGEDDVSTREYRYGDDLRRVHWKSTARRGEMMVRTDEQPRQMRATILFDARRSGHRGEGPASSIEWGISAAASVGVHLAGNRYGVRLLHDDRPSEWTPVEGNDSAAMLLDDLAVLTPGDDGCLQQAMAALVRSGGDGLVVAVLGEVTEHDALTLARLGRQGTRGIAILLATTAWSQLPRARAAQLDRERATAQAILVNGGWAVAEATPQRSIPEVWASASGHLSATMTVRPKDDRGRSVPTGSVIAS
jgi:uncharacterized protein (DUF58 family)